MSARRMLTAAALKDSDGINREWLGETMRRSIVLDAGPRPASLWEHTHEKPALIVFLRHFGCTFCREALADIRDQLPTIAARGLNVVLVHMIDADRARPELAKYNLNRVAGVGHISDPSKALYRAFDLRRGTLGQLFGIRMWLRGFSAGILNKHGVGGLAGDGFQMPGAFIVSKGDIVRAFRHATAADRPDYCELAASGVPSTQAPKPGAPEPGL